MKLAILLLVLLLVSGCTATVQQQEVEQPLDDIGFLETETQEDIKIEMEITTEVITE
jgi:outer membrane biogenesis lipoprotein LolB